MAKGFVTSKVKVDPVLARTAYTAYEWSKHPNNVTTAHIRNWMTDAWLAACDDVLQEWLQRVKAEK